VSVPKEPPEHTFPITQEHLDMIRTLPRHPLAEVPPGADRRRWAERCLWLFGTILAEDSPRTRNTLALTTGLPLWVVDDCLWLLMGVGHVVMDASSKLWATPAGVMTWAVD